MAKKTKLIHCDICNKEFIYATAVSNHKKTAHGNNQQKHCKICDKHYFSKSSLRTHIKTQHDDETKMRCDLCHEYFKNLKHHVITIHGNVKTQSFEKLHNLKPYVCELCNASFFEETKLQNHISLIHGNDKYFCGICGKDFS